MNSIAFHYQIYSTQTSEHTQILCEDVLSYFVIGTYYNYLTCTTLNCTKRLTQVWYALVPLLHTYVSTIKLPSTNLRPCPNYVLCGQCGLLSVTMGQQHIHLCRYVCTIRVPYCPAVTPSLFATYFQEKEGGGCNNEDLRFCLAVKLPTNLHTEINEALLCGRRELLQSTCHGSIKGWKSCWPRTCCQFLQNKTGSLAARLLSLAAMAGWRPQETIRDQWKKSRPVLKLFSTCLIHEYSSSTFATRAHVQYHKPARAARGGCVMEVK